MNRLAGFTLLLVAALAVPAAAETAKMQVPSNVVLGDLLYTEDGEYVLKDISGHEVRLKVDSRTQIKDRVKVGDKIEAQIGEDGHADSIRVKLPDEDMSRPVIPGR